MNTTHNEGWVKLDRKLVRSKVFKKPELLKVYFWLLCKCRFRDSWVTVNAGGGVIQTFLEKGQLIFQRNLIAKELGMKPSTLNYRIKNLKKMGLIFDTLKKPNYSILTMRNLNDFQWSGSEGEDENLTGCQKICHPGNEKFDTLDDSLKSNLTYENDLTFQTGESKEKNNFCHPGNQNFDPFLQECIIEECIYINKSEKNFSVPFGTSDFFDFWTDLFQKFTGQPYHLHSRKEATLLKSLLRNYNLETLKQLARVFFRDQECQRRGLTLKNFYEELNRLISIWSSDPLIQAKLEIMREMRDLREREGSPEISTDPIYALREVKEGGIEDEGDFEG